MTDDDLHKQPTQPGNLKPGDKPRPPVASEIPKVIGDYKIESLLEKGGMSILYLGTHPDTKEPTTIKVLSQKYLSQPEIVQRFLNEAEIIAMADHPNIVKLYGHGEWEGGLYIAMEFIQGISLRQYILQTPTTLKRALEIIIDISYALCHLHTYGVIHRDLKPENILITEAGVVKVIDFGIAQLLEEKTAGKQTYKQGFIGTPIYISPEQRNNPESVSYASDIYSLGIITYELILGKLSHGQLHLSLMPKGIQKILSKTLQPDPKDRYQDIVDFIADITEYLNSEDLSKEKNIGDQITKTSEDLRHAQMILMPTEPPKWPEAEVGLASSKGIGMMSIYCDFFQIQEGTYGIMLAEPKAIKGAEGILFTAVLRGMARALCRLTATPEEMATILNDLLIKDSMGQIVTMGYLMLNSNENKLHYLSCDYGDLLRIPAGSQQVEKIAANNEAIGTHSQIVFRESVQPWNPGDTLILTSLISHDTGLPPPTKQEFSSSDIINLIKEQAGASPQKLVDSILRRAKVSFSKNFTSRPATLISIRRK